MGNSSLPRPRAEAGEGVIDPKSNILTNSSITAFWKCPKYYYYVYVCGLRKKQLAEGPLWFGQGLHTGLELIYSGWSVEASLHYVEESMLSRKTGREDIDDVLVDIIKVQELLRAYVKFYAAKLHNQKVEKVEKEFRLPILGTQGQDQTRVRYALAGKIDLILTDENGWRCLEDHKTTGKDIQPGNDYWRKLLLDHQMTLYFYAAGREKLAINKLFYDVIKKPTIRLKKNETTEQYRERLAADIEENPEKFFRRIECARTDAHVEDFQTELYQTAAIIQGCTDRNWFPKNTTSCLEPYRCSHFDICTAGGWKPHYPPPPGFEIATDKYPELSMKGTEAHG